MRRCIVAAIVLGLASPAAAAEKCPQVLIVMDRTKSMDEPIESGGPKWPVVVAAVKAFATKYSGTIRFGFEYFNGSGCESPAMKDECSPGCVVFDPKPNAGAEVIAAVDKLVPFGATSMVETLEPLRDYAPLKAEGFANYVLLVTDGLPVCGETMKYTPGMPGKPGTYLPTGEKSVAAVKALAAAGIPTFVLGVGTKSLELGNEILDAMAEAGGVPQSGAATKYYAADSPGQIEAALDAIAGRAGGATVGGCFAPGGGGGAGGAGGADWDAGGGGGAGGGAGQGGADAGPGADRADPGCGCTAAAPPPAALLAALLLAAPLAALLRRRR